MASSSPSSGVHAAAADTFPAASYPETPRTAAGGDPSDALPESRECPPVEGGPPRGYVPLSKLPQRKADDPFVKGEPASVELRFVNRKGQRFRLFVSARSRAAIRRYIAGASACLEYLPLRRSLPPVHNPVLFDVALVDAAVRLTGRSRDSLDALQKSLPSAATFGEVLAASGEDPAAVVAAAATVVASRLAAKVTAGELTAAEVAALDVPALLQRLVDEPATPFLFSTSEVAGSAAAEGRMLRRDTGGRVSVGMLAPSGMPRRSFVVFGFDPSIGNNIVHSYKARCVKYAKAKIQATLGKAALHLWRVGSSWILTGMADTTIAGGYSHALSISSSSAKLFDVDVLGMQEGGSVYKMFGGWVPGGGGTCPEQ